MDVNRPIARTLSGSGVKIIYNKRIRNNEFYLNNLEWIKWLSYVPDKHLKRIKDLEEKDVSNLSLEEINEIREYKYEMRMVDLFKKYDTMEISKSEYMEVYNFMVNKSIDKLMLSKLSSEELKKARDKIKYYGQVSSDILSKKIEEEQKTDVYNNLSMVDAYVLHVISKINFVRNMKKLEGELGALIEKNNTLVKKRGKIFYEN